MTEDGGEYGSPEFDELYDGYQALALAILDADPDEGSYEMGYLDAWADAMNMVSWVAEGEPVKAKNAFELFGGSAAILKDARRGMKAQRRLRERLRKRREDAK